MSRFTSLYSKLSRQGIHFYTWDMGDLCAATLEVGGHFGIFVDPDNIHTEAEALSYWLMRVGTLQPGLHIKYAVLTTW